MRHLLPLLPFFAALPLQAACLLGNPSFEVLDEGAGVFAGWNSFGLADSTSEVHHGRLAAKLNSTVNGSWNVAGFWQGLPTSPGQAWSVSGFVMQDPAMPLQGGNRAIVNVEWRDAGGGLLSYESFDAATAASASGDWLPFSFPTPAAPAGAVEARLLLGLLQSPTDPEAVVYYDELRFENDAAFGVDEAQWTDFPDGRSLSFAGYDWRVKGTGSYGPGGNWFRHTEESVWTNAAGLHMTILPEDGLWYCTEVVLEEALGYGDYIFTTAGDLDTIDPSVVLGLFLWQYQVCYEGENEYWNPYNEIDVEYSRWGNPANELGQFVSQPWWWAGNIERYPAEFSAAEVTSHAFRWLPDRVEFRAWRGGPEDEALSPVIHQWVYTGPHIPRPEQPRVHINLWLAAGAPAQPQEVVIQEFRFQPTAATLPAPQDLAISLLPGVLRLEWTPVTGASAYPVLFASQPWGPYLQIATAGTPNYDLPLSAGSGYFRVGTE